jgi:hypothetical protein
MANNRHRAPKSTVDRRRRRDVRARRFPPQSAEPTPAPGPEPFASRRFRYVIGFDGSRGDAGAVVVVMGADNRVFFAPIPAESLEWEDMGWIDETSARASLGEAVPASTVDPFEQVVLDALNAGTTPPEHANGYASGGWITEDQFMRDVLAGHDDGSESRRFFLNNVVSNQQRPPAEQPTPGGKKPPLDRILDRIDDAIEAASVTSCACGCRRLITRASPSEWFATQECQLRWHNLNVTDPNAVYDRPDASHRMTRPAMLVALAAYRAERARRILNHVNPPAGGMSRL